MTRRPGGDRRPRFASSTARRASSGSGRNAVLAVSVACALAAAAAQGRPLWRCLGAGEAAAAAAADGQRDLGRRARRRARRRPGPARRPGRRAHVRRGDRVGVARPRGHRGRASASAAYVARSSPTRAASRLACRRTARRSSCWLEGIERAGSRRATRSRSRSTSPRRSCYATARYVLASEGRSARRAAELVDELARLVSTTTRSCRSRTRSARTTGEGWRLRDASASAGRVQLLGDDLFVTSPERLARRHRERDRQRGAREAEPDRHAVRRRARSSSIARAPATRPSSRRAPARPRTAGSPTSPSAGARARSRSARRRAPSARPSGTACCASRPKPTMPNWRGFRPCGETRMSEHPVQTVEGLPAGVRRLRNEMQL